MRTNYIIGCWSGPRRFLDDEYDNIDSACYLKIHLQQLALQKHELSQITLAVNLNTNEKPEYQAFLDTVPAKIQDTPVVILRRPCNYGMAFGAWAYAYEHYKDFDYAFLAEDDYAPVLDNFDKIFVNRLQDFPDCGFMCGGQIFCIPANTTQGLTSLPATYDVPLFAIGVMSKTCLDKMQEKHGRILYAQSELYEHIDEGLFFHCIPDAGFRIRALDGYSVISLRHHHGIGGSSRLSTHTFHLMGAGPAILAPVQYIKEQQDQH